MPRRWESLCPKENMIGRLDSYLGARFRNPYNRVINNDKTRNAISYVIRCFQFARNSIWFMPQNVFLFFPYLFLLFYVFSLFFFFLANKTFKCFFFQISTGTQNPALIIPKNQFELNWLYVFKWFSSTNQSNLFFFSSPLSVIPYLYTHLSFFFFFINVGFFSSMTFVYVA